MNLQQIKDRVSSIKRNRSAARKGKHEIRVASFKLERTLEQLRDKRSRALMEIRERLEREGREITDAILKKELDDRTALEKALSPERIIDLQE